MGASSRYRGDRWGEGMWEMHTRGQYWAVWNGNVWEGWGSVGVQHCCGGALMLQLTEAEPSPSCLRKWTTLRWPLFWALSRHVSPCLFLSCLLSPKWEHKYFTVSRWPLPAARWRALSPDYINRREQQKGIGQPHSYVHASYVWYTSQAICTLTVIFFYSFYTIKCHLHCQRQSRYSCAFSPEYPLFHDVLYMLPATWVRGPTKETGKGREGWPRGKESKWQQLGHCSNHYIQVNICIVERIVLDDQAHQ